MSNALLASRTINVLGATNHRERQRFINRMRRKLEIKEVLYPEGQNHRFIEPAGLELQDENLN
jgi:hypothetical protein